MITKRNKYCIYLITYNNFLFVKRWEFSNKYKENIIIDDFVNCRFNIKQPFLFLVEICLPCVLLVYWLYQTVKYLLIKLLLTRKRYTSFDKLYINTDNGLKTAVQKNIIQENEFVLEFPYRFIADITCEKINITEIASYTVILFSIIDCAKSLIIFAKKKGFSSFIYLFTSFEYFLLYNSLSNINYIGEILISNQKDRWAYMIGSLNFKNKTIIQHGTVIAKGSPVEYMNSYVSYSSIDKIMYLNIPYKLTGFNKIISFTPLEYKFMLLSEHRLESKIHNECVGYKLKLSSLTSDRKSILIIGNSNQYSCEEKQLIQYFKNNIDFELFLKPHPVFSKSIYNEYMKIGGFVLLADDIYPKVDYVISYYSTLALEYESLGVEVIYYSDIVIKHSNEISFKLLLKYLV